MCGSDTPAGEVRGVVDELASRTEATARLGRRRPAAEVLRGVSALIEPGQTVALVGPSGGGKTTLTIAAAAAGRRDRAAPSASTGSTCGT